MDSAFISTLVHSPWLIAGLYALIVADAFLVILPGETAVVVCGALAASTGSPSLWVVIPVAAAAALSGDLLCYAAGRFLRVDRLAVLQRSRVAAMLERTQRLINTRSAVLIFTARYIPFARIVVNVSSGMVRLPLRRFLPLALIACVSWAAFNATMGAVVGASFGDQPLLAVAISVPVAVVCGFGIDAVIRIIERRTLAESD
ncbi:MAG TPA: DedA family protein [Candidatus Lumbricidophila sp.]|nr:DedA family protein [Candidatus Lumbricidophila sp.]